jgi:hypothetical protein
MYDTGSPVRAALIASAAAGPLFLASFAAASAYLQLPHPIVVRAQDLDFGLVMAATMAGFIIGFLPNLVGSAVMKAIGDTNAAARSAALWTAVGAAAGTAIALLFYGPQPDPTGSFAFIATSAICARLCRTQMHWEAE